jgi:hypothetical protein
MLSMILVAGGLVAAGSSSDHSQAGSATFTLRAEHLRLYGNQVIENGVVKVENGKVTYAGDAMGAGELGHDVIEHKGWASWPDRRAHASGPPTNRRAQAGDDGAGTGGLCSARTRLPAREETRRWSSRSRPRTSRATCRRSSRPTA